MTAPLLAVVTRSVFAGHGDDRRTLVNKVDFVVHRGETLGVVGESGSGKSVLMRSVLGLLAPGLTSEGEAWFDGERIDGLSERRLRTLRGRRISLLLQDPFTMLNPLQTVGTTIAESLRPDRSRSRGQTKVEVARRLGEVGIDPTVAAKRPFQLSGGMRQRVAIAASLAADPELLVADEPTTALDVRTQGEVLALLSDLRSSRGMAMVLITHDLRVAFDTCDQVMVMYAGNVLERAQATAMRHSPLHPYTAGLMAAEPSVEQWHAELRVLAGSVPSADSVRHQCAFAARCRWVEPECQVRAPELVRLDGDRASRCRRIDDIAAEVVDLAVPAVVPRPGGTPPDGTPLLRVVGLEKTFHVASLSGSRESHTALRGVDFEVHEGEAVGLVGESGSGKTTIARSVLGLSTPDAGHIVLDGIDITDFRKLDRAQTRKVRRTVQVVFQDPYASLNPSRTIGRALSEAIQIAGIAPNVEDEVRGALERVNLPAEYANRMPSHLSGGERQRVSIARAVCLAPRLLICDEPVAALDVSVQAQVLELLRSLREEYGMAMLFITHDLAVVRQMTERVLVLNHGEMVEVGATDDVLDRPRDPYTRELIAAIPGHSQRTPVPTTERTDHDRDIDRTVQPS